MKNKFKKFIKQNYILIIIITIVICLYQYNNKFREIFEKLCIIVVIVFISLLLAYLVYTNKMKKNRLRKISTKDYNVVKEYYKKTLEFNNANYEINDYLISINNLCFEFLSGEKTIYIEKEETTLSKTNIELKKQIEYLCFDVNEINKILEIIYKYYDDNGNWKI